MKEKSLSRRDFIKIAGCTLGATTLSCSGLGYTTTQSGVIETPEHYIEKGKSMIKHILVTYATRAGSTIEIASAIGETLSSRGFSVDLMPVQENPNLDGYQAVIVGSAIRMGQWLPEAVRFVETQQKPLRQLPTAFFTVHLMNLGDDETSRKTRLAYLDPVRKILVPQQEVFFAGKMDLGRLSFLDRLIAKVVKSTDTDLRDWQAIHHWAQSIFT